MSESSHRPLPVVMLARHGETAWALARKHTGRTDIPLTPRGEADAIIVGRRLAKYRFEHVWTSPSSRARQSARIAGYPDAEVVPDLMEWDYGELEGITTAVYRQTHPTWTLFRDGGPGGESVAQIAARADRVLARIRELDSDMLIFSHGHMLRVLAARWIGLPADRAACFSLSTSALCLLGYEHTRTEPVIQFWNDTSHLLPQSE